MRLYFLVLLLTSGLFSMNIKYIKVGENAWVQLFRLHKVKILKNDYSDNSVKVQFFDSGKIKWYKAQDITDYETGYIVKQAEDKAIDIFIDEIFK